MGPFQAIADILASLAAFVAIIVALASWYRSARRPLKVARVVVHKKDNGSTFIVMVKNCKPYPVVIRRCDAYRRKKFQVQRRRGGKPEYEEFFSGSQQLFSSQTDAEIPANGHTDLRIAAEVRLEIPKKVLFLLETSHGFQELWCSDIEAVEVGKVDVYGVEYRHEFSSKPQAIATYYWKRLIELTQRCSRRLRRG